MTQKENSLDKNATSAQQFMIQRIYVKDFSLEVPNAPDIFRSDWKPEVSVELANNARAIAEDTYEVVLTVTVTVEVGEEKKVAYLVEIKQGGLFSIKGFDSESRDHLLGSYCASILFPYVREAISDAIQRAGFPAFYLQPVNFDAIYAQQREQMSQREFQDGDEISPTKH